MTSQVETLTEGSELEVVRHAGVPRRADQDGGRGRRHLRGGPERRVRLAGLPARLRRGGEPVQAARAARAGVAASLGARCGATRVDPRPSAAAVSVGDEGARHARPRRAAEGTRPRPGGRGQAVHRRGLGCKCCPIRTSRQVHIYAEGATIEESEQLKEPAHARGGRPRAGTGGRGAKLESRLQV